MRLWYGSKLNLVRDGCRGHKSGMTTASAQSSSLCLHDGWLQCTDAFSSSAAVSVAIHNIGGGLFHTMGRVRSIATNFYPLKFEGGTNPSLNVSIGCRPIR